MSEPRVSPDGTSVAVIVHRSGGDDGRIELFDSTGHNRPLPTVWWSIMRGIAWLPSGDELWFTASRDGMVRALYAVDLAGRERLVYASPSDLQLQDIARDGRVLVATVNRGAEVRGVLDGEREERTLSPFDWATGGTLSRDGQSVVFDESGAAMRGVARTSGGSYLTRTGETVSTRISEGPWISRLSPDGRMAIGLTEHLDAVEVVPIGPGESRTLQPGGMSRYITLPEWMPDSKRVMFTGIRGSDDAPRTYVQSIDGGAPDPLPVTGTRISHDGRRLVLDGEAR